MTELSDAVSLSSLSATDSVPHRRRKLRHGTTGANELRRIRRAAQMRRNDLKRGRAPRQGEPLCLDMLIDDVAEALGKRTRSENGRYETEPQ